METVVSVYCLVFNHEKYLRKTLEGFVKQKTNFPYQVIIHDDASTDNSAEIIKEYSEKYPGLFVTIFQKENQYSRGGGIFVRFVRPLCTGKYIAICEGDDCWCDSSKLQQQVDYMESHPECSLCTHDTQLMDENGDLLDDYVNGLERDRDYGVEAIIKADGGGLFQTSSVLARNHIVADRPEMLKIRGIGDYPLAIYAGLSGHVHYIGKVMSYYRVGHSNSWVSRLRKDIRILEKQYQSEYEDLSRIDEALGYRYSKAFEIPRGQRLSVLYRKVYGVKKLIMRPGELYLVIKAIGYRFFYKIRHFIYRKLHTR